MTPSHLNRRAFLQAAGVTLALPLLESAGIRGAAVAQPPRRMLAVCTMLGLHAPNLFPREAGANYTPTPYLKLLAGVRDQVSVISGLSHPEVDGGHSSEASFLTAAPHPGAGTFRNTISLDQFAIEKLHPNTRFPCLVLGSGGMGLSFSRNGVAIPPDTRPSKLFTKLFVNGSAQQTAAQVRRLKDGQSIMDAVLGPAKRLQSEASASDRERLDQYFSAVREVEERLIAGQEWAKTPKPKVSYSLPKDGTDPIDSLHRLRLLFDLAHLALQTDSTRIITLHVAGASLHEPIPGVNDGHHNLSHHGQDPEKLAQLRLIESKLLTLLAEFLGKLKGTAEAGDTLLGRTAVIFGSNLGNASSHSTKNLPILVAGGGFKHGQHLAFDQDNNTPLCRLFVSVLQRLGTEVDQFASGKGTLPGLELVR